MKKLFLIRHAKSSWGNPQLKDVDRPLNERGKRAAPDMGRRLVEDNNCPELIMTSSAKRAKETANLIANTFENRINIKEELVLYHASTLTLLRFVNQIPDKYSNVFLVGHNPGMTDFAEYLTDQQFGNLPTAAIVGVKFEFDSWRMISGSTGDCFLYDYPKKLS